MRTGHGDKEFGDDRIKFLRAATSHTANFAGDEGTEKLAILAIEA
jgi:hypothetical protein